MPSRRIFLLGAATVGVALAPLPAFAHAILEDSQPRSGATIAPGAISMRLRFNSRIDRARSRLTLTRPDKSRATLALAPDTAPEIIATQADLTPGAYVLRWQVLAVDGHITRGDIPFTLSAP